MIIRATIACLIAVQALAFHTTQTIVGPSQGLKSPAGVAISSDGTIYVADSSNLKIKAIGVDGTVTIIGGSGKPGSVDGIGTGTQVHTPSGLALDETSQSLFIADTGNHLVRRLDLTTGNITTVAGTDTPGFTDGSALQACLHEPRGLTFHQGVLYISDTKNHAIRAFDLGNDTITTVAGNGTPGFADGTSGLLKTPSATAADEQFLYVADTGNHSIRRVDLTTRELTTIAGATQPGYLDGPGMHALFKDPQDITIDGHTLYVADTGNHSIRAVSLLDASVTTIAGTGKLGYQDGPAGTAQFKQPAGIIAAGALFVADTGNDAIRAIWRTPTITSINPNEGPPEGGTTVTITGTGFVPGRTTVIIAGLEAATTWINSETISVVIPAGPSGTADVTVTTPSGSDTFTNGWTWVPPYTTLSIEPDAVALDPDETRQFTAYGHRSDGSSDNITALVTWESSQPIIASITTTGLAAALTPGSTLISVTGFNLNASAVLTVRDSQPLPPDPADLVADTTVNMERTPGTSFLILLEGDNPVQREANPAAFDERRLAVIRGRVTDDAGLPIPGVRVQVSGQPGTGWTLSRHDGRYDLLVNGGGLLTINWSKDAYIASSRQVATSWVSFTTIDDVLLVRYDARVTRVDLTSLESSLVTASTMQDADGVRTGRLLFRPGTSATLTNASGIQQELSELNVRVTEFTVGTNGPEKMPATLPSMSAYTYCVELSVDEAQGDPYTSVAFNQPLYYYVENFLGFPVGEKVPVGSYDRATASWVPELDGLVITVLPTSGAIADIDTDGDGAPETPEMLVTLNIDSAEREILAATYPQGAALWRVPITHFSPWDFNYPIVTAFDGFPEPTAEGDDWPDDANVVCGSIIECQNQGLREMIPISGTPYNLVYSSSRVPGRSAARTVGIQATNEDVPAEVTSVEVTVEVAGQKQVYSFAPQANISFSHTWDGKDAWGRYIEGSTVAKISVTYVVPGFYSVSRLFGFGVYGTALVLSPSREEQRRTSEVIVALRRHDQQSNGLGGWSLDAVHQVDRVGNAVLLGDGNRQSNGQLAGTIERKAGNAFSDSNAATCKPMVGPGSLVRTFRPEGVTSGPDGSVYFVDWCLAIRRITRAGNVEIFWRGPFDAPGLGRIYPNRTLTMGPDGWIYMTHDTYDVVFRVSPLGAEIVAGNGTRGFSGDNGPATEASFDIAGVSHTLKFGPDGGLYVIDGYNHRIRRIDPSGVVRTVAGNGLSRSSPIEGQSVTDQPLSPFMIAIGPDGRIYSHDHQRIYYIDNAGTVETLAQIPPHSKYGFGVGDLEVGPDGDVYFLHGSHRDIVTGKAMARVFRFTPDGRAAIAVEGSNGPGTFFSPYFTGDEGGIATDTVFNIVYDMTITPDGALWLADRQSHRIRRVQGDFTEKFGENWIPAPNGASIFHLDSNGRHARTMNATTLVSTLTIDRDTDGRVTELVDENGLQTTLTYNDGGVVITAPNGKTTSLTKDANGYLSKVSGPTGEYNLTHGADGLLEVFRNPRGHATTFEWTGDGRLKRDSDAAGGSQSLTRTEVMDGWDITLTSAEGRTRTFKTQADDAKRTRENITTWGGSINEVILNSGIGTNVSPNGTLIISETAPHLRFGMDSPVNESTRVRTPSGLELTTTYAMTSRSLATFTDPLSLTASTEEWTINDRKWTTKWAAADRTVRISSPLGRSIEQFLDGNGRVTEVRALGITASTMTYDTRGRIETISQGARTYTFTWNAADELVSVTDPLARSVRFGYDDAGRAITQTLPDDRVVGFAYDENGNVTGITPPGRSEHTFGYNEVNLQTSYTAPAVEGLVSTTTRYEYNLDRDLTTVTRPDGMTIGLSYDTGGRLSLLSAGSHAYGFGYDTAGRLSSIGSDTAVDLSYAWDGFLPTSVTWSGEVSGSVSWSYDNDFRVTSEIVAGSPTAFAYDADSLLTRAGDLTLARDSQNGRLTGTSLGTITDSYQHDALGQLAVYSASAGGSEIFRVEYARDDIGRITTKTETRYGVTFTDSYGYDLAGRLTSVSRNGEFTETWEYDANGNRTRQDRWAGGVVISSTLGTYDAQDRLLTYSDASYTYTTNGELLTKAGSTGTTAYTYDALGNLRRVDMPDGTVIEYVTDGQNRRVGRKVDGVLERGWLYGDQLNPIAELDADGNVVSRFIYGSRLNVPDYMVRGGITYRIVSDHLGSVRYVLEASTGAIIQSLNYDAWGNVHSDSNPVFQPFGFAGGLHDSATGLTRFGARDYDAGTGRWAAKDPIGFFGGDVNHYLYVEADPINFVDPSGLYSLDDFVEDAANFSAGFGDSLTFGLTSKARNAIGGNEALDKCGGIYAWGQRAEIGFEMAALGVSGGLKYLAKSASRKQVRAAFRNMTRSISRNGGELHHVNPLFGHPGGATTLFPTGGLPAAVHSGSWNLQMMPNRAAHVAAHRRFQAMEKVGGTAVNPLTTGTRVGVNTAGACGCP